MLVSKKLAFLLYHCILIVFGSIFTTEGEDNSNLFIKAITDISMNFKTSDLVFVSDSDKDDAIFGADNFWKHLIRTTFVSFDQLEDFAPENQGDLSFYCFVVLSAGVYHSPCIRNNRYGQDILLKKLNATKSEKLIMWLLPHEQNIERQVVRLDSNIYLYKWISEVRLEMSEIYSVPGKNDTIVQIVLRWDEVRGISWILDQQKWNRRANLSDVTLRDCILELERYNKLTTDDQGEQVYVGFNAEIIYILQKVMNFKLEHYLPEDLNWGMRLPNGTWNGIMRELIERKADISTASLMMAKERLEVVDGAFSTFQDTQAFTVLRETGKSVNFMAYLSIVTPQVWFTCLAFSCVFVLLHWKTGGFLLFESFKDVFLCFLQRDDSRPVTILSQRLNFLVMSTLSIVLYAHFSAVLTSVMTVKAGPPKVETFSDILEQGRSIFLLPGTIIETFLIEDSKNEAAKKVYENALGQGENNYYVSDTSEVENKLRGDPKLVYFGFSADLNQSPLRITRKYLKGRKANFGIMLQKNSEFTDIFNFHLLKLMESGVLEQIEEKWYQTQERGFDLIEAIPLGYENVIFPFLILCAGLTFSSISCLVEKLTRT